MPVMTKAQYAEWVKRVNAGNKIIKTAAPVKKEAPEVEKPEEVATPVAEPELREKPKAAPKKTSTKKSSFKKSKN